MERIKLIAFDMDGTILNNHQEVSEYTVRVLNEASRLGIKLVPITGRPLYHLLSPLHQVQGIAHAASSNGAVITDIIQKKKLQSYPIKIETVLEICDLAESLGLKPIVFAEGYIFRDEGTRILLNRMNVEVNAFKEEMDAKIKRAGLRNSLLTGEYPIEKIAVVFESVEEKKEMVKHFERINDIVISYALDINIEINAPEATKGKGLERIAQIHGIPLENTMVIGDGVNDLSMIQKGGFSVVMGNALKELHGHGDYVTLSNEEDGAAKAIEKFVLQAM